MAHPHSRLTPQKPANPMYYKELITKIESEITQLKSCLSQDTDYQCGPGSSPADFQKTLRNIQYQSDFTFMKLGDMGCYLRICRQLENLLTDVSKETGDVESWMQWVKEEFGYHKDEPWNRTYGPQDDDDLYGY